MFITLFSYFKTAAVNWRERGGREGRREIGQVGGWVGVGREGGREEIRSRNESK